MELMLAVAASPAVAEAYRQELKARGYKLNTFMRGDRERNDATKTFMDPQGFTRAEIRVSFIGFNDNSAYEFDVSVVYGMGTDNVKTAGWFSVHLSNVSGKLDLVEAMLADTNLVQQN